MANIPSFLLPALTGLIGIVVGGFLTHHLSVRRDIAVKRREIILEHLMQALHEIESAHSGRQTPDLRALETAVSRIQMVGDEDLISKARDVVISITETGKADNTPLYLALRNKVRKELNLARVKQKYVGLIITLRGEPGFNPDAISAQKTTGLKK